MANERIINVFTWEDVDLDQVADGVTYGRVLNSALSSGRVVKLAEAAGKDLTVVLGAVDRVLTLGANVALNQNLRITDTPTLAGLTIVNPITEFSTDGTLGGNSDNALPTEKAVRTYVLSQIGGNNEFTELLDTPSSYDTGDGDKFVKVRADLLGLEFVDAPVLDDLNTLGVAASDGQFIVATGAGAFAYESGNTARTSLGVGTADTPTLAGLTIVNLITEFSTDGTLGGNSDSALPTEKAVRTYVLSQIGGNNEFIELLDTPASYDTVDGDAFVKVKADLSGLEFIPGDVLDDINALGVNASDGEFLVGTAAGAFAWEKDDTARTSLGVGTGDSPTFAGLTVVNAIDEFSTDGTLVGDSDSALPTEKAVKTYVDAQVAGKDEFIELDDTPSSYDTIDGETFVMVKADLTGLEFVDGDSNPVRTLLGLGTGDSPTFTAATIGSVAIPGICTAMTEPTGFVDTVAVLSWDDPTYTLTITGNHDIYINGVKTTKTTDSVQIADSTGIHYVYYNAAGTLVSSTVHPGFALPLVATVYWNTTMNKGLIGEERHGIKMDGDTHNYLHYTVGTRYESGLTGTFDDTTLTITAGVIADEDLANSIAQQTTCNVLYKNGAAEFEWDAGASVYYKMNGVNLRYNNGNALADVGNNRYVAYWVFATNDTSTPIVSLMGQREDILLSNARANNTYESLTLGTLPFEEMKLLYRVILRNTGAPPTYIEVQDLRSVSNLPAGTYVATSHSVLTDLTGTDDHSQYALLAGRPTGQTLIGSTITAEDLTLKDNSVDNNTITVTQAIAAYTHVSNNGSDHSYIDQAVTVAGTPTFAGLTIVNAITEFSTDGTLGGDSDSALPTEKAVKTYVDTQIITVNQFIELTDTPASYDTVDGETFVKVKADLSGLEFVEEPELDDLRAVGPVTGDNYFLVGIGAGALAWETTTTVRTSIGLGTGDTVQFANYTAAALLTACASNAGELDFTGAGKKLDVEDDAVVSQDYSSDATPTFAGLTIVNAITEFSTDGTLGGDSDSAPPTEKAVKTYVDTQIITVNQFIELTDTPSSYDTVDGETFVKVKADLSGLEFVEEPELDDLRAVGRVPGDSYFLVGTGANALNWETTTTVRTSLGLGTSDSPTFAGLGLTGSVPALILKNSDNEHGQDEAESLIKFTDHTGAILAQIQGHHENTADDTKGGLALSTHNGTVLTEAIRVDEAQRTGFGLSTPEARVHVRSASLSRVAIFQNPDTAWAAESNILFTTGDPAQGQGSIAWLNRDAGATYTSQLQFRVIAADSEPIVRAVLLGSSGFFGLNTIIPTSRFEIVDAGSDTTMAITCYSDTEADTPLLTMRKADGSEAAPALVDDNAVLGTIHFDGYDGSGWHTGGKIEARIDGTPSDGADMPTVVGIWTTPEGSATPVENFLVSRDGDIKVAGGVIISDNAGNLSSANGASFGPGDITTITVVNGIVTAIA